MFPDSPLDILGKYITPTLVTGIALRVIDSKPEPAKRAAAPVVYREPAGPSQQGLYRAATAAIDELNEDIRKLQACNSLLMDIRHEHRLLNLLNEHMREDEELHVDLVKNAADSDPETAVGERCRAALRNSEEKIAARVKDIARAKYRIELMDAQHDALLTP